MPSKYINVKAHKRLLRTRIYKFVCKKCNNLTTRESYAGSSPLYCEYCRPPKKDIWEDDILIKYKSNE